MIDTIIGILLLVCFLGLVVYQVIKGKPTRLFHIKYGLNIISKTVISTLVLVGMAMLIMLAPEVVSYLMNRVVNPTLVLIFGAFWVILCTLVPCYVIAKIVSLISIFSYNQKELDYMVELKEKDKKDFKRISKFLKLDKFKKK